MIFIVSLAARLESFGAFCGFPKLGGVSRPQKNMSLRFHRLSELICTISTSLSFLATKWIAKPQEKIMLTEDLLERNDMKRKHSCTHKPTAAVVICIRPA